METMKAIRNDLMQVHVTLVQIQSDIENERRKFGIKDIVSPDASFDIIERAKLTAISEDIVATFLQANNADDFLTRIADKKWAHDRTLPKIVEWLNQSEQRTWLTFLLLATTGKIREEIVALVGAKMHSFPTA